MPRKVTAGLTSLVLPRLKMPLSLRSGDYRISNAITMSTMKIVTGTTHGTVSAKVIKTSFSLGSGGRYMHLIPEFEASLVQSEFQVSQDC